jgi:N-carbamoylputrescine amidase
VQTAAGRPAARPSRRTAATRAGSGSGATGIRDKYFLRDEPGFWEATWYGRGEPVFDLCAVGEAATGVLLCTELWFLETARHFGQAGADLLCLPRATPYESLDKWLAGGRVAAVCSGAYCASSNQWTPGGSGLGFGGLGWLTSPDGEVLATTTPHEPFATVEIDLAVARNAKTTYPRYVAS